MRCPKVGLDSDTDGMVFGVGVTPKLPASRKSPSKISSLKRIKAGPRASSAARPPVQRQKHKVKSSGWQLEKDILPQPTCEKCRKTWALYFCQDCDQPFCKRWEHRNVHLSMSFSPNTRLHTPSNEVCSTHAPLLLYISIVIACWSHTH